jgi:hypothetical protein
MTVALTGATGFIGSHVGFVAIDLSGLVAGGVMQQIGGPLAGVNLIRQ